MSNFRGGRPGSARAGRWVLLVLVAAVALAAWLVLGPDGERGRSAPVPPAPGPDPAAAEPRAALQEPAPTEAERAAPREAEHERAPSASPTARLAVTLQAPPGADRAHFELRGAADERVLAFALDGAAPRTELDCAPQEYELYLVPPRPRGLTARPVRLALRAGETRLVTLELVPAWTLHGHVFSAGVARGDVPIALERQGVLVATTTSLFDGRYALADVPAGDYALVVGDPLGPLVPRETLQLDQDRELDVALPPLFALLVRVLDEQSLPVAGATVEGKGESGGRVLGLTDADGRLAAEGLPPGNYRLFAAHPGHGRGNRIFVLSADSSEALEIRLLTARPR